MKTLAVALSILLWALSAALVQGDGVQGDGVHSDTDLPENPRSSGAKNALQKVGEAKLTMFFFDIYESSLFTPTGRFEPGVRPLRLEIRYLRDIAGSDLVEQTGKEWQAQNLQHPQQDQWLERLNAMWPDVKDGDVLALEIDTDNASRFTFNGELLGRIEDADFGPQFAAIWLSPDTTRPKLREQLIRGGD